MSKETVVIDKETAKAMPVCPICGKEMHVTHYIGYYEDFTFWDCECREEDLPKATDEIMGSYA